VQPNGVLKQLAARVSPGVAQVLATRHGPAGEKGRGQTALIARAQAAGSGLIADHEGYAMTDADVAGVDQRNSRRGQ